MVHQIFLVQHISLFFFVFGRLNTLRLFTVAVLFERVNVMITCCRSQEVKEALRVQMEVQRRLHEQVEVILIICSIMLLS
jgi:hypothetical protein